MLYNHSHQITIIPLDEKLNLSNGKSITVASGETVWTPVVARSIPHLFFNVMIDAKLADREAWNWARISRVELTSGTTVTILSPADVNHLELPQRGSRVSVAQVVTVSDDGQTLTIVMGVPSEWVENGVSKGTRDNYGVYDLDVATKKLTKLRDLVTPFG